MKFAALLIFIPFYVFADIYKCEENGVVVFSDSRCGKKAERIKVTPPPVQQKKNSFRAMQQKISEDLYKDRRRRELDQDIFQQERALEKLLENRNKQTLSLERELADLRANKDTGSWRTHPYKKEEYKSKEKELKNKIKQVDQNYSAEKKSASKKLSRLISERKKLD